MNRYVCQQTSTDLSPDTVRKVRNFMNNWEVSGGTFSFDGYRVRLRCEGGGGGDNGYWVVTDASDDTSVKVNITRGQIITVSEYNASPIIYEQKLQDSEADDPEKWFWENKTVVLGSSPWNVIYVEITWQKVDAGGADFPNGSEVRRVASAVYGNTEFATDPRVDSAYGGDLGAEVQGVGLGGLPQWDSTTDTQRVPIAIVKIGDGKIEKIDRVLTTPLSFRNDVRTPYDNVLPDPEAGAMLFGQTNPTQLWQLLDPPNWKSTLTHGGEFGLINAPTWVSHTNHAVAVTNASSDLRFVGVPNESVPLLDNEGNQVYGVDENGNEVPLFESQPIAGTILRFDGNDWEAYPPPAGADDGWVLTLEGTDPFQAVWRTNANALPTAAKGDMLVHDGSDWILLEASTATGDDVVTWDEATGLPVWSASQSAGTGYLIYMADGTRFSVTDAQAMTGYDSATDTDWSLEFDVTSSSLDGYSVGVNPIGTSTVVESGSTETLYTLNVSGVQTKYRIPIIRDGARVTYGGAYRENIYCAGSDGPIVELVRIG